MNKTLILTIVAIFCGLTACDPKKSNKSNSVVMIKGDPIAFVAKAKGDPNHLFAASFFEDLGAMEISLNGMQEEYQPQTYDEVVEDQKPENWAEVDAAAYTFEKSSDGMITVNSTDPNGLSLTFSKKSGGYFLSSFGTKKEMYYPSEDPGAGFKVIHNSSSKDGLAISTLVYGGTKGSHGLINIVIMNSHKPKTAVQKISNYIQYMAGIGVKRKLRDQKNIQLMVCNAPAMKFVDIVQDSANLWKEAANESLNIKSSAQIHCPPFSDLNTRTFTYVENFVEQPEAEMGTMGMTLFTSNINEQVAVDSDVFILKKEYEDAIRLAFGKDLRMEDPSLMVNADYVDGFRETVTHELGHFLGLHHQFDPNYPSVMSYDSKVKGIQAYDRDAIQKLYAP